MLEGQTITAAALKPLLHYSDRLELEAAVEAIIAELDQRDPDPDLEDGEHLSAYVDAFGRELNYHTLADQLPEDDADGGDRAWQEWDARDAKARRRALHEPIGGFASREDDEDDDSPEDDDPREDGHDAEAGSWAEGAQGGPAYADDDREQDEPEVREAHRQYLRRDRCRAFIRGGGTSWAFEVRYLRDDSGARYWKGARA